MCKPYLAIKTFFRQRNLLLGYVRIEATVEMVVTNASLTFLGMTSFSSTLEEPPPSSPEIRETDNNYSINSLEILLVFKWLLKSENGVILECS